MGLKNATILSGASIGVTGGTTINLADNGVQIPNGCQMVVREDTDYATRRTVTAKTRPAVIDAKTSEYGKDKKSITLVKPTVLPSGRVIFNVIRVEREVHPTLTAAECFELNKLAVQLLVDGDLDGFWDFGTLS